MSREIKFRAWLSAIKTMTNTHTLDELMNWDTDEKDNGTTKSDSQDSFTTEQASNHAKIWCANHRGWQRICDIEDSDALYKTWDELPAKVRKEWEAHYGNSGEAAWLEFGRKPCKVPNGFITGKGEFYENVLDVPILHNLMMVFQTSKLKQVKTGEETK